MPAVFGSVHCVSAASPFTSDTTLVGEMAPAFADTAKTTLTPGTPLPAASFTTTRGSVVNGWPTTPVKVVELTATIETAAPALSVSDGACMLVRLLAPKLRVTGPGAPTMARSEKVAMPLSLVETVVLPVSVLFPAGDAIVAVIEMPDCVTLLPYLSVKRTTGCGVRATPLCAFAPGAVTIAKREAASG